ncbi:phage tail tube protein [Methylobacterium nodulans]|uniref:Tail tube protein n=1 Tax=Methylobacterium nodulans (strain LMG 21967 / CNCM I-2342 / ORS 2060) TaxID=460265 RepID=B8ICL2_METNO|nr:phage tail tube protein [Methylobacterium nodulans]ACL57423.1 conserved hypothetical protein [Methylobacterium nodulans ORS 2060]
MDTKGGRYTIDIGGRRFSGRSEGKVRPARAVNANGVNWDGSAYSSVAPKLASIELSFDRGQGIPWDETMLLQKPDVTFEETDAGVVHYLTAAGWDGEPEINTKDGEVTGLKLESDQYRWARTR